MSEVLFASTTRVLSFFYLIMSGLGVIKAACEKDAETEKNRISIFFDAQTGTQLKWTTINQMHSIVEKDFMIPRFLV